MTDNPFSHQNRERSFDRPTESDVIDSPASRSDSVISAHSEANLNGRARSNRLSQRSVNRAGAVLHEPDAAPEWVHVAAVIQDRTVVGRRADVRESATVDARFYDAAVIVSTAVEFKAPTM